MTRASCHTPPSVCPGPKARAVTITRETNRVWLPLLPACISVMPALDRKLAG